MNLPFHAKDGTIYNIDLALSKDGKGIVAVVSVGGTKLHTTEPFGDETDAHYEGLQWAKKHQNS